MGGMGPEAANPNLEIRILDITSEEKSGDPMQTTNLILLKGEFCSAMVDATMLAKVPPWEKPRIPWNGPCSAHTASTDLKDSTADATSISLVTGLRRYHALGCTSSPAARSKVCGASMMTNSQNVLEKCGIRPSRVRLPLTNNERE